MLLKLDSTEFENCRQIILLQKTLPQSQFLVMLQINLYSPLAHLDVAFVVLVKRSGNSSSHLGYSKLPLVRDFIYSIDVRNTARPVDYRRGKSYYT